VAAAFTLWTRGKDAFAWKAQNAFHFSTATTTMRFTDDFYRGLLRTTTDETTVERRAGKPDCAILDCVAITSLTITTY
jgi:hypothetical protein